MTPPDAAPPCWHYAPAPHDGVELAHWQGTQVPLLQPHFHRQTQLSFVLRGSRVVEAGGQRFELRAGDCLAIPAGVAHRGLAHAHAGTVCLNVYAPAERTRAACVLDGQALDALEWHEPVARIARRLGLGREAFTRRFAAQTGLPPHAWRLVDRLNVARERLRGDAELADLALELGFTDQSHLGRHFRRVFGVSPGRYRRGMRPPSQTS